MSFVTTHIAQIPFASRLPAIGTPTTIHPLQARVDVRRFASLMELADALRELDGCPSPTFLRVVIVLDETFCGSLAALARREQPAGRLTIATEAAHLAGVAETYALEGRCWNEIVIERGIEQALARETQAVGQDEQLILFLPQTG